MRSCPLVGFAYFFSVILFSVASTVKAEITPSDVYERSEQVVLEIQHLRNELNVQHSPRVPGVQNNKKPLHVYAKSLEILEKIHDAEVSMGLAAVKVEPIPLKVITPEDVFQQAELILEELRKIQNSKNVGQSEEVAQLVLGKTPSDVYQNFWKASFMLDGLAPKISPDDVYQRSVLILKNLELLANKHSISLETEVNTNPDETTPYQVNLQAYLNLHKFTYLEKKYGLNAFRVPEYPQGEINPSDVYDAINMMMAELAYVKRHHKILIKVESGSQSTGKKPKDVLSNLQLVGRNIDLLISGIK
ncbi:MAG: hypothetical protein DIZ80_15370 [endosymbiont of Galathealinum brachiosum]|uniref:Uncharacterized protein n=1 Tax=endosymbiont of Galathealinum brachiosum TaxID=2200906 RepID=A0A370DA51_9GAMM|nr:MAG: hypothetical protein DIZ80_15370 [endosymbiont of Galathealinum brachiosum]